MADESKQIQEYFDSVEMTEAFRQRLLDLPRTANASPKARSAGWSWKPLAVAAVLILLSLAGVPLLRSLQAVTPEVFPTTRSPVRTETLPWPETSDTELTLIPTETVPITASPVTETQPAVPVESSSVTVPPLPTDPTNTTHPTDRTEPTLPPVPTDPTDPPSPTDPTDPTYPTDHTDPTLPVTEPPVTEPTEDVSEPFVPEGNEEIPAEDLGWIYEVQSTGDSLFLRITDTVSGEVCPLDLTGLLEYGEVCGRFWIFGRERDICLCKDLDGGWLLYVLVKP